MVPDTQKPRPQKSRNPDSHKPMDEAKEVVEGPELSTITPRGKVAISPDACRAFESCLAGSCEQLELQQTTMPGVYFIDNVLSVDECNALIDKIDTNGALSFWCADKADDPSTRSYRNAETIEMHSDTFADALWSRVSSLLTSFLPPVDIPDDEEDESYERDLMGRWVACGTNPDALFARYPSFGSFAPHTDGRAIIDFNTRSHYSVILYLNTVPLQMGAGTRFYDSAATQYLQLLPDANSHDTAVSQWTAPRSLLKGEVEAVAGRMAFFKQSWVHEGVPPVMPYKKYIIRSDIIFRRDPAICDTPKDRDAYKLFREAEELAESGRSDEAIPLFRRAFKMSPDFSRIMGQS